MSDKTADLPASPPEPFFSGRRIWAHLLHFRETYLHPAVGAAVLYVAIRLVHFLTGRAVIDDPGSIVHGLYNAILCLVAITIAGANQGHTIPDVDANKEGQTWQMHAINCLCTTVTLGLLLFFIFH